MRINEGYGSMMSMPYGHMGMGMLLAIVILLAIGFGVGYAVGRTR